MSLLPRRSINSGSGGAANTIATIAEGSLPHWAKRPTDVMVVVSVDTVNHNCKLKRQGDLASHNDYDYPYDPAYTPTAGDKVIVDWSPNGPRVANPVNPAVTGGTIIRIAEVLPSGVNTVTFSSIPQTYRHLLLISSVRDAVASAGLTQASLLINSVSTSSYTYGYSYANNGATTVGSLGPGTFGVAVFSTGANAGSGAFCQNETIFTDYTISSKYPSWYTTFGVVTAAGGANFFSGYASGSLVSAQAISSLVIGGPASANFSANSRFTLYGVL